MIVKVTYLAHSGFLLEWEHCYWLFDYFRGTLPPLNHQKKLFVFCSHSHGDHFNPAVFSLADSYQTEYIFSGELKHACKKVQKKHPEKELPGIRFLSASENTSFSDGAGESLQVHAMCSTDCGVAFVVDYRGKTIYHAGDLHWWVWPGEPEEENRQMTGRYKKEMEYLNGRIIDLAFSPLDGRQEEYYDWGLDYLIAHTESRYVFPMHFWDDFSVITRYLERGKAVPSPTEIMKIEKDGQSWEVTL